MIKIRSIIMMLSVLLLTASCLNTDDTEYTYYNDTAIKAFSLGTLNRTYWGKTKYTDKDSLYRTTVTGSKYDFYIDQAKNLIYNVDSLPKGTDTKHVICTVTTANSGIAVIRYESQDKKDSLVYYSSTDSVDFSEPREFRAYAQDGSAYRKYTVQVNVHKELPDSFTWSKAGTVEAFKAFKRMKACGVGEKVVLLGYDGSKTVAYTTGNNDGKAWTLTKSDLDADAYKNTAVLGGTLYVVSDGQLLSTTDGASWTDNGAFGYKQLLGAGSKKLYAMTSEQGIVASEDNGQTWAAETVDGDAAYMPENNISFSVLPSLTNKNTETVIMTGLRDLTANPTDTAAVVWGKVEEYSSDSYANSWVRYQSDGGYKLPALSGVTSINYGPVLVALGASPMGGAQSKAFSGLYVSRDGGLTWQFGSNYILPSDFDNGDSDTFTIAAGKDSVLWIISGGTGTVWRGWLNKLRWTKYQSSFTE